MQVQMFKYGGCWSSYQLIGVYFSSSHNNKINSRFMLLSISTNRITVYCVLYLLLVDDSPHAKVGFFIFFLQLSCSSFVRLLFIYLNWFSTYFSCTVVLEHLHIWTRCFNICNCASHMNIICCRDYTNPYLPVNATAFEGLVQVCFGTQLTWHSVFSILTVYMFSLV